MSVGLLVCAPNPQHAVGSLRKESGTSPSSQYWEFCGPVEEVDLMTFPDTGRFRGIAIVTFQSQAEAEEALKYNGEDCEGKRLVVKRYNKPGQGPAATTPKRCLSV